MTPKGEARPRKRRVVNSRIDQTKFDKFLQRKQDDLEPVKLFLAIPVDEAGAISEEVFIITVDRYMLEVERVLDLGNRFWISKSVITSVYPA